jgi:hypothetical protein
MIGLVVLTLGAFLHQAAWSGEFDRRDVTFKSEGLKCAG